MLTYCELLCKSIVHCRSSQSQQRVGVELLEASVADLNRFDLRKTHQFGNFKYDPGKYYTHNRSRHQPQSEEEEEESNDAMDEEEISEVDDVVLLDKSRFDDEIEAPWNQYAWAEELRLRVSNSMSKNEEFFLYRRDIIIIPWCANIFTSFLVLATRIDKWASWF